MKRLVKWVLKSPPHDLVLVAQGIDQTFLLWFLCTGLILAAMVSEMALRVRLIVWALPAICIIGFLGVGVVAYQIGARAVHAGWLLGSIPCTLVLCLIMVYGSLASNISPEVAWTLAGMLIGPSLCGSVIGHVRHRRPSGEAA